MNLLLQPDDFRKDKAGFRVIIVGAGEVGFNIARRLAEEDKQVVIIDPDPEALKRVNAAMDVQTIQGSGASPMILDQAELDQADMILAVTDSDEVNLIVCVFASAMAPDSVQVARVRNQEYLLYKDVLPQTVLNIGMVINPELEFIKTLDQLIKIPGAIDYTEFAEGRIKIIAVRAREGYLTGAPLSELRGRMPFGTLICAMIRGKDEQFIIPTGRDMILPGDLVYFVCEPVNQADTLATFGYRPEPIHNVMIVGGGGIGLRLAELFEHHDYHVRLIDLDPARCAFLAEKLDKTVVLCGDGTEQDFLREENIQEMDVVFCLTKDDETNILTALLARRLGAKKSFVRVNKLSYLPVVRAIGIEHSISPRLSAINSILRYVRKGRVLSSFTLKGEEAELMEVVAVANSFIVSEPIKFLHLPPGIIILSIIRDDVVIIPNGDSLIKANDRVLIFAGRQLVSRVEEVLTLPAE